MEISWLLPSPVLLLTAVVERERGSDGLWGADEEPQRRHGSPKKAILRRTIESVWSGVRSAMKHMNKMVSRLGSFSSGAGLGGKVSPYRKKQNIYTQGEPAYTLFYSRFGRDFSPSFDASGAGEPVESIFLSRLAR